MFTKQIITLLFLLPLAICIGVKEDLYLPLEPDQDVNYWEEAGWKMVEPVEPHIHLKITFAIKQQNKQTLEELLLKVSDPDSDQYGKYLNIDQITKIVAPSQKSIDTLRVWLTNNGVPEENCQLTANRDFLVCQMPVRAAEDLLKGTSFSYFQHDELKELYIQSASAYHVPRYVAEHLDFVGGIHRLPNPRFLKPKQEHLPEFEDHLSNGIHIGVYPKVLRQRYNLAPEDVGAHPNNSQVVVQFLEQYFSNGDLREFMYLFVGSDFVHQTNIPRIVGPNPGRSGVEASLDTQYIMGTGANITTWFWSTGGRHEKQEPFLTWLMNVGNTTTVPHVHSVSYGEGEVTLSSVYMQRVNVEFMKLGLRGVSILFASGDDGAACHHHRFSPAFPSSSPYVTAVGGTAFSNPFTVSHEKAYEISGGGFSNEFKQPAYQADAVKTYFNSTKVPPEHYFNKTGRAYPDVAAICRHYWIVNNRIPVPGVMGTSASTPVVAGIISMVNEHRLKNGKPAMGFLNPFIYKNPDLFNDITEGYNEGCQHGDIGFYATKGFDPVTGYGSPDFPKLVKAAMKAVA